MFNNFLKDLSILKKFLFINLLIFVIIGSFTVLYLQSIQPSLINNKKVKHIQIIDNTIDHIKRLNINFKEDDIRKFLFSTRFLFQNLDRVTIFDSKFNLIGDTDTLDLDPRSFSQRLDIVEMDVTSKEEENVEEEKEDTVYKNNNLPLTDILIDYTSSPEFGKSFTFTQESYDQFLLTTIKNVKNNGKNIGYLAISENANDIRAAINERKSFIMRSAGVVAIVILIFSYVLNRFFLKPIKNLVNYTNIVIGQTTKLFYYTKKIHNPYKSTTPKNIL